ncbi:MAG: hypothetical protein ACKOYN_00785 [Planctomycetota bacterium]
MGCMRIFTVPIGAVLGYLASALIVLVGLTVVLLAAGPAFCYEGSTWTASQNFCFVSLGVGLVAALAGGFVATRFGGRGALVLLVLAMIGLGSATALGLFRAPEEERFKDRPAARPENFDWTKAAVWSETPPWCEWANLGVGLVGAVMGGSFALGRRKKD